MYYLIRDCLTKTDTLPENEPCVILMTTDEWKVNKGSFPFSDDLSNELIDQYSTHANVRQDCLTGSFMIMDRNDLQRDDLAFSFILNDRIIVFVDDSGYVDETLCYIRTNKKWQEPCMERFLYDFLDSIIKDDLRILQKYEMELEVMEDTIEQAQVPVRLNEIRSEIRRFNAHYEQLLDLAQELDENENGFFREENMRYFRSFIDRLDRMLNTTDDLRDYVIQIEDMNRDRISLRQNEIMTVLTVITSIFMPLTLIAGWYGMNFRYMPELNQPLAYPAVILVSILIAVGLIYYFKKKKWL